MERNFELICLLCGGNDFSPVFIPQAPAEVATHSPDQVLICTECGLAFKYPQAEDRWDVTSSPVCHDDYLDRLAEQIETTSDEELWLQQFSRIQQDGNVSEDLERFDEMAVGLTGNWEHENVEAIRLDGTLEAAANPIHELQRSARRLGAKGLLIVTVADFSEWQKPLYGEGASLQPQALPNWFFTPATLARLLQHCGFKVLRVTRQNYPQPAIYPAPSLNMSKPPTLIEALEMNQFSPAVSSPNQICAYATFNEMPQRIPRRNLNAEIIPQLPVVEFR
jgi:hypothetical protein